MGKVRVLVADDAVVVRRLLTEAISQDPQLEVAAAAANGKLALQRLAQVQPDAVVLDVDMPEMDGIATLKELRKLYPKLPVIMFSAHTDKGAATAIEALISGASDCLGKPTDLPNSEEGIRWLRRELIPKIKAQCHHLLPENDRALFVPSPGHASGRVDGHRRAPRARLDVVAIGVSTGGPQALVEVFSKIGSTPRVPILIVQHMPPLFTKRLADSLNQLRSSVVFHEGEEGMPLEPGHAYIAPGGKHMLLRRAGPSAALHINEAPPENSCRPSADVLFRSVAAAYGAGTLAVVLTGMGTDGLNGCEAVRAAGGRVLAQDQLTSVVWGMPGFVVKAGLADEVLPIGEVGARIGQLIQWTSLPVRNAVDIERPTKL